MNVAQLLEASARYHAERPALVAGDRRFTYRELDAACSLLAGRLRRLGVGLGLGDRLLDLGGHLGLHRLDLLLGDQPAAQVEFGPVSGQFGFEIL